MNFLVHVSSREDRGRSRELVRQYITSFQGSEHLVNRSRIMDTLIKIVAKQDRETPMNSLNGERIEKIATSLLSSSYNYTPLLHFVIPMDYGGMKAFSELWIDPRDGGRGGDQAEGGGNHVRVLIISDIPGIRQMGAKFIMTGRELGFHLYCPESYAGVFEGLIPEFRDIVEEHGYRTADIGIERIGHVCNLTEVFKNLPSKRAGVDVKI